MGGTEGVTRISRIGTNGWDVSLDSAPKSPCCSGRDCAESLSRQREMMRPHTNSMATSRSNLAAGHRPRAPGVVSGAPKKVLVILAFPIRAAWSSFE